MDNDLTLPKELWILIFDLTLYTTEYLVPSTLFARVRVKLLFLRAVSKNLKKYCREYIQKFEKSRLEICPDIMAYLASNGYLSCLIHMRSIGAKWTVNVVPSAVQRDQFSCLQYAIENGCQYYHGWCLETAMEHNNLQAMQYLHEKENFQWLDLTCTKIVSTKKGNLSCLMYAHEHNCPWDDETCETAAFYGHLDCLQYAHENGSKWNYSTCDLAALNGHLTCLIYALDHGCTCYKTAYAHAAQGGHVEIMQYLHENSAVHEWDPYTCQEAAKYGHVDCLKYAYENGAPFNNLSVAAVCKSPTCLQFVHETGWAWQPSRCRDQYDQQCAAYAHEQGWCSCTSKYQP